MKVNCLSITFWFNIIDNENDIEEMIREASTENDDFIDYYKFVKLMLS